jgi:ABC-2 type transport system ATP-binding protein
MAEAFMVFSSNIFEGKTMIRANNLHKSFGQLHAVDGVSLQVADGEIYGLVGPDGAGKTTLLRLICGALHPQQGDVSLGAFDVARQVERAREQIGYLAQRFALYEELTVLENLRFFAEVRGLPANLWKPRSQEILEFVGLAEFSQRRAGQLSGGMKQKLGLALALINRPRILLLDEPTTGVDPLTRQDFWRLIIGLLQEENLAVLVSTPYMDEAVRCQRVGFMRRGKLISEGTPRQLRARLEGRIVELDGSPRELLIELVQADTGVETVQRFGNRLHLRVREGQAQAVIARLGERIPAAGGRVEGLRLIEAQLEDVFIALAEEQT